MASLITDVAETVESTPDSPAIVFDGSEQTYRQFWHRTGQFAQALADHGIGEGDRVGIYLPNLPQFVTAFYGTLRAGGIVVPMNPQYKAREISHLLGDSGAKAVISLADNVPEVVEVLSETDVEEVVSVGGAVDGATAFKNFLADETLDVVERADDDVAVQPYTSGTTGTPKGVLLTHRNIRWTTNANANVPHGGFQSSDRLVGTLPLFHIYGMSVVMNGAMYSGGAYYPIPEWNASAVMDVLEEDAITIMFGVPAMFNDMINQPDADTYEFEALRFVNSGGSSLPLEVLERFEKLYDIELYEGYGLTETSPVTHANRGSARRKGSIGTPLDGVDAKVVTELFETVPRIEEGPIDEDEAELHEITGELVVSGPNVMKGYYGLPKATEEAFTEEDGTTWFHTGDICYWDEDDFFYVVDREKHMIVTGGYNVYPREIEELLFEHEAVADAAVVGVPDERRGETVKAFIVPMPDATAEPEDIKEYCLEHIAAYKHPREVEFVEELPRTTTGKVQKFKISGEDADG
ncbi:AMP-binding protein [Natrarchaeobaculum sulfurireducens]|uniref:Acyl-CoA synthetase (AMP-forming)/AMP-acid ligase II n=1 Tax=Natrarchaeobaculum sulfurireducens TaxID=2044521 RepID=A0A346PJZ9_9EURY|nr:AMP-binding protein [Natrarchaeobaculum sulfurireducens]AXR76257.1 long-chain-fatty-acid--CoA ligase [Natrarchaeobaculum sulfurireducens]AXR79844.1 Acyl-CoA synthetase (AMP-forming)/AMP-acid ligase II [Natrarchaeobaculum sulfurireducens]